MAKSALGRSFGSLITPPAGYSDVAPPVAASRRRGVGLLLSGHESHIAGPVVAAPRLPQVEVQSAPCDFVRFPEPRREATDPQAKFADPSVFPAKTRLLLFATDLALIGVSIWLLVFSRDAGSLGSAIAGVILLAAASGAGVLAFRD